jgi:hypothetical protein
VQIQDHAVALPPESVAILSLDEQP